ncbi:hypothetical protein N7488_006147 [Penicillium malachiteum]|nr:hypothetical protein N7488_006147 [Penicillium malachiteum]
MKERDWGDIEERYLKIAELLVRNCQYVSTLTDMTDNEPSSPIREYDSEASGCGTPCKALVNFENNDSVSLRLQVQGTILFPELSRT